MTSPLQSPVMRTLIGVIVLVGSSALFGCGPSPEEQAATAAAQTATAATKTLTPTATSTPTSTNTATATPTPIPYDLSVLVTGEDDLPIAAASVTLLEAEEDKREQMTDNSGEATWNDLPTETINLAIAAQGYIPSDKTETIERGSNQLTVVLERDPFGLIPSEVCGDGEKLLYVDDFQDEMAQGWMEVELGEMAWRILSDPDSPENIVVENLAHQRYMWLTGLTVDNAVWRGRLRIEGLGEFWLNWRTNDDPGIEEGDQAASFSGYQIYSVPDSIELFRVVWPISHISVGSRHQRIQGEMWHDFELSFYGGQVEFWMDGKRQFIPYQDPSPLLPGLIGIEVAPSDDFSVLIDNMAVCELSAPFVPKPTDMPEG